MSSQLARKQSPIFLVVCCTLLLASSAVSKDRNRVFSGQAVYESTTHGVQGVVIRLRPMAESGEPQEATTAATADNGTCTPPDLCQTTGHGGKFSFHQVKTGIYDLVVYKDGQVIYSKPDPLLIPEMPTSSSLVIALPKPQNR